MKLNKKVFVIIFLYSISYVHAQERKWSLGTYIMPGYVNYSLGRQKTNLNLISGIRVSRRIYKKINLVSGIYYYKNNLYGDSGTCWQCIHYGHSFLAVKTYQHSDVIEMPIEVLIPFKTKLSKRILPGIGLGTVLSTALYTKETDIDYKGNLATYTRNFLFSDVYLFMKLGVVYKYNNRVDFIVDFTERINFDGTYVYNGYHWYSVITYHKFLGLSLGISIRM